MKGATRRRGTVLIAEDEKMFANVYRGIIRTLRPEYSVFMADNGVDTIKILQTEQIDMMVMGLKMPRIDGFGVLEYLLDQNIALPMVIVTALWYSYREVFQSSGLIMTRNERAHSREYRILQRYKPLVFGFFPAPVHKMDFQNAIMRCEVYRDRILKDHIAQEMTSDPAGEDAFSGEMKGDI
jgi:CheY-like chemotaxis protein